VSANSTPREDDPKSKNKSADHQILERNLHCQGIYYPKSGIQLSPGLSGVALLDDLRAISRRTVASYGVTSSLALGESGARPPLAPGERRMELSPLEIVYPDGLDHIGEGQWEQVLFTMDSGAMDTVVNMETCPGIPREDSRGSKLGLKYEVANGEVIPNKGQKRLEGFTDDGVPIGVIAQVAGVNKPLMSVMRTCHSGNTVVFDDEGSYVYNKASGIATEIKNNGRRYLFPVWVQQGFTGQGPRSFHLSTMMWRRLVFVPAPMRHMMLRGSWSLNI
jgi:hypothetical protein